MRLRHEIESAKRDYRDVLGPAEYPGYTRRMFRIDRLGQDEHRLKPARGRPVTRGPAAGEPGR